MPDLFHNRCNGCMRQLASDAVTWSCKCGRSGEYASEPRGPYGVYDRIVTRWPAEKALPESTFERSRRAA